MVTNSVYSLEKQASKIKITFYLVQGKHVVLASKPCTGTVPIRRKPLFCCWPFVTVGGHIEKPFVRAFSYSMLKRIGKMKYYLRAERFYCQVHGLADV